MEIINTRCKEIPKNKELHYAPQVQIIYYYIILKLKEIFSINRK